MSTISLRVPERELNIFRQYAAINNKSISEMIRDTMMRYIEDEYDIGVFEEYEEKKATGRVKTFSHKDVWEELGV